MTINELKNIVELLMNQYTHGAFSPEEFNRALQVAHENFFTQQLGVFAKNQSNQDDLNPLKKRISLMVGDHGVVQKPSDYVYGLALRQATGKNQQEIEIELLSDAEWANRTSSALIDTATYPIARIDQSTIQVSEGPNRVILHYLRRPINPVWGYTLTSVPGSIYGRPTYDSTATVESDFQNSPTAMHEILYLTTQALSMNITRNDLVEYAMIKNQQ